jgi:hypothetical protein
LSAPSPTSHYRFLHHGLPHRCLPSLRRSSPPPLSATFNA